MRYIAKSSEFLWDVFCFVTCAFIIRYKSVLVNENSLFLVMVVPNCYFAHKAMWITSDVWGLLWNRSVKK